MAQTSSHASGGIASINPMDGRLLRQFQPHSEVEVERRLQTASDAFQKHRRLRLPERARLMLRESSRGAGRPTRKRPWPQGQRRPSGV